MKRREAAVVKKIEKSRVNSQVGKTGFSECCRQPDQGKADMKAVEEKKDKEIAF
ncbi:MAG: hypothetical protein ACMUIA_01180 [bacterium]